MLRILSVLCVVVAAQAFLQNEAMMKKYGYMKIMSSCLGEETVLGWKMRMKAARDVCKGKDTMQTIIDIQAMLKNMKQQLSPFRTSALQQLVYVPVPYYQSQPYLMPQSFRTKRSMDLSPEGIKTMKEEMMMEMSNFTCVMQELKYFTNDNQPNYEKFNEELNKMNIAEPLKENLREALDMCRDFAMCMPVEKAKSPIKKELGTSIAFMKCMHMKKVMVCMANDFKKYAPMMGFEGDNMGELDMMGDGGSIMAEISSMMMDEM